MKMRVFPLVLGLAALLGTGAAMAQMENLVKPVSPPKQINLGMSELGKKLFFDPRLSKSGFISCNSCHKLSMGDTDNNPTSIGDKWQQGPISAPTVRNVELRRPSCSWPFAKIVAFLKTLTGDQPMFMLPIPAALG